MSGVGFDEDDILTAVRALLDAGRSEVSVLDVLSYIKGSEYVPPEPESYANDLPFALACNAIETLAAQERVTVIGAGSEVLITGIA